MRFHLVTKNLNKFKKAGFKSCLFYTILIQVILKFIKWLLYFLSLGAFIWFVYFKPIDFNFKTLWDKENITAVNAASGEADTAQQQIAQNIDQVKIQDAKNPSVVKKIDDKIIDSPAKVEDNTEIENNEIPEKIQPSESINLQDSYLVLVGSFGKHSNAKRMLKIVEKNGIRAVIKKIGKLHRVIIASSNTEQEANVVKETYKKTFGETPYVLLQ